MNFAPLFAMIPEWEPLETDIAQRFSPAGHGDFERWNSALRHLPDLKEISVHLRDTVLLAGEITTGQSKKLDALLRELSPWRKGPFDLFGIKIDTEWRSDWKWQRVAAHLDALAGRRVLDVGCGNGYFGWRMLEAEAALVVGVDPTLVFCMQHQAINHYVESLKNWVVPLPFEQIPVTEFDTVFSMGVVYHRREPEQHLSQLYAFTRPGGQLVLESLIVENDTSLVPDKRYARMRNVWVVPSRDDLVSWARKAGYRDVEVVDVCRTTTDEQHTTSWMRFDSLQEALDPEDPLLTIEGYPAPIRAVVVGWKPG